MNTKYKDEIISAELFFLLIFLGFVAICGSIAWGVSALLEDDAPPPVAKSVAIVAAAPIAPQPTAAPALISPPDTKSLNPVKDIATQIYPYSNPGNAVFGPVADMF